MNRFPSYIKFVFDNLTIVIIILSALFLLLVDGSKYKNKNFIKEYRIVRIISYSYIVLGIIIFVFLRMF